MFDGIQRGSVFRTILRTIWLIGVPCGFYLWLFRGRTSVIYVSWDPFWVESNTLQSNLPTVLAEAVGYYQGTFVAVAMAIAAFLFRAWRRPTAPGGRHSLGWFLPLYIAGLEAIRHIEVIGTRHGRSVTADEINLELRLAGAGSACAVLGTVLVGWLLSRFSRSAPKVPFAVVPVLLGVSLCWAMYLTIAYLMLRPA